MIKVMIVDSDCLFINRLCGIIRGNPDFELYAAVQDGASAQKTLARGKPDVLLVGLGLPDMNAIDLIHYAANTYQTVSIMVITVHEDEQQVLNCIESGAIGFFLKDSLDQEFASAIYQLHIGGSPISPLIARMLLQKLRPPTLENPDPCSKRPKLSPRESEMLAFLAKGLSYIEIANLLEISPHTVTTTVQRIYRKLAVHSRSEAVFEASRMGLIS
jgi:DNA-binding NarL/FixJ family response regulator